MLLPPSQKPAPAVAFPREDPDLRGRLKRLQIERYYRP